MNNTVRTFNGATAVITGGASGIGRALSEELAKRGSEVVLADRQIELARQVASHIQAAGGKAQAHELDVADFAAVESLLQTTAERTGRLDYVFNNAGIGIGGPVELHTIEDWRNIMNVNLWGVINGVQAAYQIMIKQGFGHIVNTASMAGLQPAPGMVSYGTTKHAVVGLSMGLRPEAALVGIRVSVLCPGVVRTPILEGGKYGKSLVNMPPEQQREAWEKMRPMPADVFAIKTLEAVARNEAIILIPSWWKLFWWIERLSPSWMMSIAQREYKKISVSIHESTNLHNSLP